MNPRVESLITLLLPTQYHGIDDEKENPKQGMYTMDQVIEEIQASRAEIFTAMQEYGIVQLQGYIRLLSREACNQVCRYLLDTIIENSLSLDSIDAGICHEHMHDIDPVLLDYALKSLGEKDTCNGFWKLSYEKIAIATAHYLFCSQESTTKVSIRFAYPTVNVIRDIHATINGSILSRKNKRD